MVDSLEWDRLGRSERSGVTVTDPERLQECAPRAPFEIQKY
jgi:hypothetical protein